MVRRSSDFSIYFRQDLDIQSGMEFGWGLGFAADINRRWHAQVEGTLGLSNMCKTEDIELGPKGAHLKRAEISVGIGYNF